MNFESINNIVEFAKTHEVKIVAATKTRTPEEINLLAEFGITAMGENRVQELLSKYDGLNLPEVHFIGTLQTNKVKYIVDKVCMIQSVDRLELALEIEKRCALIGKIMPVLIEVNVGGEESKSGCSPVDCFSLAKSISELSHLKLSGLMSVLPINADETLYCEMKKLYDKLKTEYSSVQYLSMGMSDDYSVAVKCGANMIRPGTALFGARIYPTK